MGLTKESVEELLKKHLPAKTAEKEEFGEVFTPPVMIEQLLDNFPAAIWKQRDAVWLDPAAGIGNFPIYLFFRYMDGLKHVMPNATKRAEHIVQNMLYMVEINTANTATLKRIFKDLCPSATPNLFVGDFLSIAGESGVKHADWPTHYTAVIGNPPYNVGGTKKVGEKRYHIKFAAVGLTCLKPKGYLAFICPPNYREAGSTMNELFQEHKGHFTFIKMFDWTATFNLFRIQARVDSFIYQVGDNEGKTKVIDIYDIEHMIDVDLTHHVPNFGFSIFKKLQTKVNALGHVKSMRTAEMAPAKAKALKCGSHKILHLIISKGRRIYKVNKKHSLEGVPKALINGLGIPYVYYDKKGEYGMSASPIVVQKPSAALVSLLEGPLFNFIAWGLRMTGNNNMPYLMAAVPDVKTGSYGTYDEIEDFLGLTASERKFLEAHFKNPESQDHDIVEPPCGPGKTRKANEKAKVKGNGKGVTKAKTRKMRRDSLGA
jgi:hypothetical protein